MGLSLLILVAALRLPSLIALQNAPAPIVRISQNAPTLRPKSADADAGLNSSDPSRQSPAKIEAFAPPIAELDNRAEPQPEEVNRAASRVLPERPAPDGDRTADVMSQPRNLIELPSNRAAYQFASDLKAALESEAWEEAASAVTAPRVEIASALAPDFEDKALLASIPVTLAKVYQKYPRVRHAMGERFEMLANLRLAEAKQASDAAAMEFVAAQFPGTAAASQAREWLGDLALGWGKFREALLQYGSLEAVDGAARERIATRLRLAAAMLGRDVGGPVESAVALGDITMEGIAFENLITEMRERHAPRSSALLATDHGADAPAPTQWKTGQTVRDLFGPLKNSRAVPGGAGRQARTRLPTADELAAIIGRDDLYVVWQGGIAAVKLSTGERRWNAERSLATGEQPSSRSRFYRARPLIAGDRLFVRQAGPAGMSLQCFDADRGTRLWQTELGEQAVILSDPVLLDEHVITLGATRQRDEQKVLRLLTLDRATGRVLQQRDIVRLGSDWFSAGCCEVVVDDEGLVVDMGAAILSLDTQGAMAWLRLSPRSQPQSEERRFPFQQPLIHGDRVYIASPDGEFVECVDRHSGQRYWTAGLPALSRLAGCTARGLVVINADSVSALSLDDGNLLWRKLSQHLAATPLVSLQHVLITECNAAPQQDDRFQTRWTWLEADSGRPLHVADVLSWATSHARLGPVVPYQDGLFCLAQSATGPWELTYLAPASHALLAPHERFPFAQVKRSAFTGELTP